MPTKFFTNSAENTLFQKFVGILANMGGVHAFHAVVGYFRASGYFAMQPHLRPVREIKILVGINVDAAFAAAQRKGLLFFGDPDQSKRAFMEWFAQDLREAKYDKVVEQGVLDFVRDIIEGRIEVRAHHAGNMHAKFYLFLPEQHNEHSDGWVIMGSSNLTESGLGVRRSPNYELNIALKDYDDVAFARQEFERLWAQSTPILPVDAQGLAQKTHLGRAFTPFELYLKLLVEYFGKNIDYDPDSVGDLPKPYKKLSYQVDAVNEGFQMLMAHNGFFLADVVGLGKTVVACLIARRFLVANGSANTRVLVVYPPALEKNWKTTFRQFGLEKHAQFVSNGSLDKILDEKHLDYWNAGAFDLVLVDEAHRYRNHTSAMFGQLQRICKAPRASEGLVPGKRKKVMLISATPLNNRPQDLYHQLLLFQDARNSTLPVTNLQAFFWPIQVAYRDLMKQPQPDLGQVRALYTEVREKIIAPVTVRRTRRDLAKYPKYLEDLREQGIVFPEIAQPRAIRYQMGARLNRLFYHTVFYLTDKDKIGYYRYQAIRFLRSEQRDAYYEQAEMASQALAGIMKSFMVKRLESSFVAFKKSLSNMVAATERMVEMFEKGRVLVAPDLDLNALFGKGLSFEEIEERVLLAGTQKQGNRVYPADDFEPHYLPGLQKDLALLRELQSGWDGMNEDPKIEAFFAELDRLRDPSENPEGLLVVFTESNDTAEYLQAQIQQRSTLRPLKVSSDNRSRVFETILQNFDANWPDPKRDLDVLITTDVLAEGINLHRANVLVNYDTPWNATRLMQRIGRVNRIGSKAGRVFNYNFYPSTQGDEEIRLYRNALVKLQAFHSAFGEDAQVFTHEELVEQFELFKEGLPDEEDKRLYYLRFIREYKESHPQHFRYVHQMPLKARAACTLPETLGAASPDEGTLVFLKSPYKIEFYAVDARHRARPLTFLEAAARFAAGSEGQGVELPSAHYTAVRAAVVAFEQEFFRDRAEPVGSADRSDGHTARAKKFLRGHKAEAGTAPEAKRACAALMALLDKGTFAQLPNELRKLEGPKGKKSLSPAQIDQRILQLAQKYAPNAPADGDFLSEENGDLPEAAYISPDIVLSLTFVPKT